MFVDVFCTDTFNTNTNISDTLSILLRIKYKAFISLMSTVPLEILRSKTYEWYQMTVFNIQRCCWFCVLVLGKVYSSCWIWEGIPLLVLPPCVSFVVLNLNWQPLRRSWETSPAICLRAPHPPPHHPSSLPPRIPHSHTGPLSAVPVPGLGVACAEAGATVGAFRGTCRWDKGPRVLGLKTDWCFVRRGLERAREGERARGREGGGG